MQKKEGLEIERRFLVRMPEKELLESLPEPSRIVQSYLIGEDGSTARVRMSQSGGETVFTHTVKRRISAITREEHEREISRGEYEALLSFADPERQSIEKLRYYVEYCEKCFELDIFSFFKDRAIIEIELSAEDEMFELPPCFSVIKEVTGDKRYTNASMALCVPYEEI